MTRSTTKLLGALAALVLVVAAGCGDDTTSTAGSGDTTTMAASRTTQAPGTTSAGSSTGSSAGSGSTLKFVDSDFGKILADGEGNVLYLFTPDTGTSSTCNTGCIEKWPAVPGPATSDGIGADDLGTTTRDDGTTQATFAGHPVYRFAGDSAPGDVNGQGLGGKWYVIDQDGNAVTKAAGSGSGADATTTTGRYGY